MRTVAVEGSGLKSRYQPQTFSEDFISMRAGPVLATGNDLDISMSGSTVLGVTAADGALTFTRRGDLRVNASGALETGAGTLVRSQNGGALTVPPGVRVTIRSDGTVFGSDPAQPANTPPLQIGVLLLRDASQTPLQRREDGLFAVSGSAPGADIIPGPVAPNLTAGALEGLVVEQDPAEHGLLGLDALRRDPETSDNVLAHVRTSFREHARPGQRH